MKLGQILKNLDIISSNADMETEIGGICYDSRKVQPGDLFVAVKGFELLEIARKKAGIREDESYTIERFRAYRHV